MGSFGRGVEVPILFLWAWGFFREWDCLFGIADALSVAREVRGMPASKHRYLYPNIFPNILPQQRVTKAISTDNPIPRYASNVASERRSQHMWQNTDQT